MMVSRSWQRPQFTQGVVGHISVGVTRRVFSALPGAAALVARAQQGMSGAKKRKKKGDVNKLCKRQPADWTNYLADRYGPTAPITLVYGACGESLKTCNFSAYFTCMQKAAGG